MKRKRQPAPAPKPRHFIAAMTPEPPKVPVDTAAPMMGQRKRPVVRRARLFPTPLQAD